MESHVDISHVGLAIEGRSVLCDVDLRLTERRIGIIGRNGSGKSTLARVISGLIAPDTGRVSVGGVDVFADRKKAISQVGIIFQNPDHQIIFPTVAEDVAFGPRQLGNSAAEAARIARDTLARFGVAHWADRAVASLSHGQKHLVCLISVLAMAPSVLVLDEPFTGLDMPTTHELTRFLAGLDQMVLHITHDLNAIRTYDRVIWIEDGKVAEDGEPEDVITRYVSAFEPREKANAVTYLAS